MKRLPTASRRACTQGVFWLLSLLAVLGTARASRADRPESPKATSGSGAEEPSPDDAETEHPEAPRRAPVCEATQLRLIGSVAVDAGPAYSYALIRVSGGTAMLSPGERISGHRLLAVGLQQVLMRSPDGERCRLVMYHSTTLSPKQRRARKRRARQERRKKRRERARKRARKR